VASPVPERLRELTDVFDGAGGRELDGAGGRELDGALPLLFGGRIDLARADAAALEVLPRVGPALAAAIVAERERVPFCRLDDLERVRGIGPRTRAGLESWLEPGRDPRCARLSDRGGGP
jgi:hypothetical protein